MPVNNLWQQPSEVDQETSRLLKWKLTVYFGPITAFIKIWLNLSKHHATSCSGDKVCVNKYHEVISDILMIGLTPLYYNHFTERYIFLCSICSHWQKLLKLQSHSQSIYFNVLNTTHCSVLLGFFNLNYTLLNYGYRLCLNKKYTLCTCTCKHEPWPMAMIKLGRGRRLSMRNFRILIAF